MKNIVKVLFVIAALFGFVNLFAQGGGGVIKTGKMLADDYIIDQAEYNDVIYILSVGSEYDYYYDEYYSVYKLVVFDKRVSFFVDQKILTKIPNHNIGPTPEKIILKRDGVYIRWFTYDNISDSQTYIKKAMDYYKRGSSSHPQIQNGQTHYYAALAISTRRYKIGYSYKFSSLQQAKESALRECNRWARDNSCFTLVWAKDQCIAFAGYSSAYGWGRANDKYTAERYALDYCKQYSGTNCKLLVSICANGR